MINQLYCERTIFVIKRRGVPLVLVGVAGGSSSLIIVIVLVAPSSLLLIIIASSSAMVRARWFVGVVESKNNIETKSVAGRFARW